MNGEQGSAKSTASRLLRKLIDPSAMPLRTAPKSTRDLAIASENSWVLAFDNVSSISQELSDALCRTATGGGFATRALYKDAEEAVFEAQRPILLNGITDLLSRGDLIERSLIVHLPEIRHGRRSESDLWREFNEAYPRILGALYDAVSAALRNERTVNVPDPPRLADFARWVTAAEPALGWEPGTYLRAEEGSRADANELALESSPLAEAIRRHIGPKGIFGPAAVLLDWFEREADSSLTEQRGWPSNARSFKMEIQRLKPNLRAIGIEVDFRQTQGGNSKKLIYIWHQGCDASDAIDAEAPIILPAPPPSWHAGNRIVQLPVGLPARSPNASQASHASQEHPTFSGEAF
jgi:hypothetical protein